MLRNINTIKNRTKIKPHTGILLIFLITWPLCVRFYTFSNHLSDFSWYGNNEVSADAFLYYRSCFLLILSAIMIIFLLLTNFKNLKAAWNKSFWMLLTYAVFIILSSIFSKYAFFSWNGIAEQFESCFILLSYILITYYTFSVLSSYEDIKFICYGIMISISILCVFGFFQLLGQDIFKTPFGLSLILPADLKAYQTELHFKFDKSFWNKVYMTLYNPNYVGVFASLFVPFIFTLAYFIKNRVRKIICVLLAAILLILSLGSGSKTIFFSYLFSAILMMLLLYQHLKNKILSLGILVALVFSFVAYSLLTGASYITYIKQAFTTEVQEVKLQNIQLGKNSIEIEYKNEKLILDYNQVTSEGYKIIAQDAQGNELSISQMENGLLKILDERFTDILLAMFHSSETGYIGLAVEIDGFFWRFVKDSNENFLYFTDAGKLDQIQNAPSMFFEQKGRFASGRGYIWSRTIPLLSKNIILGSGPDTYMLVFPQNDYIGKYQNGFINTIIYKPHSLYLQIGVQTGLLSLAAFLIFYGMYFYQSLKLYFSIKNNTILYGIGSGILTGTVGYMISGLTNDSCLAVAPYYWLMLGLGLAVNKLIIKISPTIK